jgi:PAS domain S-box-containing protein
MKVKQRTQELYSSAKEYRELVESANSIILRWDKEGRILFLNTFGLDLFGYSPDEIIGRNVMGTIVPEQETTGRDLQFMINDIIKDPAKYKLNENENICKDGSRICIQWTNKAILDENGQFKEILSIGTDITDRKKLEADLIQSRKMEAIGTLAGGIAHDFNNVLAIIFGFTELAQLDKKNPDKVEQDLEQIYTAATRAKDLVNQILTFSRKHKRRHHHREQGAA